MLWLLSTALAAVDDVFLTTDFSTKTLKLQQLDSLVFHMQKGSHRIIQVTKDQCEAINAPVERHEGQNYLHEFKESGVFFFATQEGCAKGFRMVVEVEPTPVNPYVDQFKMAERQFLLRQGQGEQQAPEKSSAQSQSIGLLGLVVFFLSL